MNSSTIVLTTVHDLQVVSTTLLNRTHSVEHDLPGKLNVMKVSQKFSEQMFINYVVFLIVEFELLIVMPFS